MFQLGQILDQLSPVEQPRIARLPSAAWSTNGPAQSARVTAAWPAGVACGVCRRPSSRAAALNQMRRAVRAPGVVSDVVARALEINPTLDEAQVTVAVIRSGQILDQLSPVEQREQPRIAGVLADKVIVSPRTSRRGCAEPASRIWP